MRVITLTEHERVARSDLGRRVCAQLQQLDERLALKSEKPIFDWNRRKTIKARNWVGVIQVDGLAVEVVPKIDGLNRDEARRNLLYMLAYGRKLPVRERELAGMRIERMPLLEALVAVFAQRLLEELRLGPERSYVRREENCGFVRGKLLLSEHLRRNAVHQERVYVAYDEFLNDTALNQILKRACRALVVAVRDPRTQRNLREASQIFDGVSDVIVRAHHFDRVHLTRATERFATLLEFCRLVLLDGTPSLRTGQRSTFSVLFPMEEVYEQFIAQLIRRNASAFGLDSSDVHVQARSRRRWLLRDRQGRGRFRLKPDLLVTQRSATRLIVDTKWKRLAAEEEDSRNRVSQSDIYQMYAYARRYDCSDTVLLYPSVSGVSPKDYLLAGDSTGKRIRVELVNLGRDLRRNQSDLLAELRRSLQLPGTLETSVNERIQRLFPE